MAIATTLPDGPSGKTHAFIRYPAKFPADPVHEFLLKYSKNGDSVLDPFCGSGTVLVEAIRNGRTGIGIELNPVAALASRVKARRYSQSQLNELHAVVQALEEHAREPEKWVKQNLPGAVIPTYKNVSHWFEPVMLEELACLRTSVVEGFRGDSDVREVLWLAFLKIIIPASKQDSETRYTAVTKDEHERGFALTQMKKTLTSYAEAIEVELKTAGERNLQPIVHVGDSLEILGRLAAKSVDLVITSPPYINTYDYYLYHKHRIFWYGHDPVEIRRQEVGCHHRIDTQAYDVAVSEYESYLASVFSHLARVLKTNGHVAILIGDGIVKDRIVAADEITARVSAVAGFKIVELNSVAQTEVSRGFIKDGRIARKKHHAIVLQVTHAKARRR